MSSLRYPLRLSNGQLETTEDEGEAIGDAILSSLMTMELERALRPYYGRDIELWQTQSSLPTIATSVKRTIETGLMGYPPTQFKSSVSISDNGVLVITVVYQPPDYATQLSLSVSLSL